MPYPSKRFGMAASSADHFVVPPTLYHIVVSLQLVSLGNESRSFSDTSIPSPPCTLFLSFRQRYHAFTHTPAAFPVQLSAFRPRTLSPRHASEYARTRLTTPLCGGPRPCGTSAQSNQPPSVSPSIPGPRARSALLPSPSALRGRRTLVVVPRLPSPPSSVSAGRTAPATERGSAASLLCPRPLGARLPASVAFPSSSRSIASPRRTVRLARGRPAVPPGPATVSCVTLRRARSNGRERKSRS